MMHRKLSNDIKNRLSQIPYSSLSYLTILSGLLLTFNVKAEEFFNPALLSSDVSSVADLSRFDKGEGQPAGNYRVDIYLNDNYIGTQDMAFSPEIKGQSNNDESGLVPCLTEKWLSQQGVNIAALPVINKLPNTECVNLPKTIEKATTHFDFERQRLNISIPQAMLSNSIRGYISPELWDEGILSGLLNYRFTGSHSKNTSTDTRNNYYFLNLNSGLNIGAWRLRNEGVWNYTQSKEKTYNKWNNIRTYAQRAIIPWKSSLVVGESFTDSDIFDSVGFRGVRLASDDSMLPDSMRGFAPTVRGIANSNAQVTIEQNGYVIYQAYVPPGAFTINDLYSTSNSGNLKVTVKEADGSTNQFTVPYSSVPALQREGRIKYALSGGEYRSGSANQNSPKFGQGTLLLGLSDGVTLYEGMLIAENYQSFAFGLGKNLGEYGAVSADITHANSVLPDDSRSRGQSVRFLYAKSLNQFGTNFQLLGYRYSTKGFYTLPETSYRQMKGYSLKTQDGVVEKEPEIVDYHDLYYTKKGRLQANISQQFGDYGSAYVVGSYQTYWHTNQTEQLWQLGYNGNWEDISFGVNASLNKSPGMGDRDKRIAMTISVPLNRWLGGGGKARDITNSSNAAYATYSVTYDQDHKVSQQAGVSGTLLSDNNLNYSVQQGYANQGEGASGNAALDYRGGYGSVNAGYSYGKHWQQVNYGMSGGIILHENGLTLSQPLSDTNILVKAEGANGVSVENATGVKTDWRGYAVVPYATAYRNNRVALNMNTLGSDSEVEEAVSTVVPTHGALVRAEFNTHIGARAMLTLKQANGKPVPFGSMVNDKESSYSGIVGDDGKVFMSGLAPTGQLKIVWGSRPDQQCLSTYQLSGKSDKAGIYAANVQCSSGSR
ncbi:fimbrial biogenesis usher protein [Providencia manganoxydans]|uniref:fimbrial biogenesis usher protein n=1 Tax=Providencia manganoxydans TaxID=2923283 RepID=UPI0032D9E3D7